MSKCPLLPICWFSGLEQLNDAIKVLDKGQPVKDGSERSKLSNDKYYFIDSHIFILINIYPEPTVDLPVLLNSSCGAQIKAPEGQGFRIKISSTIQLPT